MEELGGSSLKLFCFKPTLFFEAASFDKTEFSPKDVFTGKFCGVVSGVLTCLGIVGLAGGTDGFSRVVLVAIDPFFS